MTSTDQQYRPNRVRPGTIKNRITHVLGVHGVEPSTIESIWASLTTGDDPMPEGVPSKFNVHGVTLVWPAGVGTRIIRPEERKAFNLALERNGNELLDSEDSANEARRAYTALLSKSRNRMRDLVEEACGEPVVDLTAHAQEVMQLDGVLCAHRKPGGRLLCLEDNHHAGLHANGKHTWNEDETVVVQRVAATTKRIKGTRRPSKVRDGVIDGVIVVGEQERQNTLSELDDLLAQLNAMTTNA